MATRTFGVNSTRESWFVWWLRWVRANAVAELLGLGVSALLWIGAMFLWAEQIGVVLGAALVVAGSTLAEGTAVGVAQWSVLRRRLPQLSPFAWWGATSVGALVAWTLGMVPSTMMDLAAAGDGAPPPEISDALQLVLAAGMGLVLGPILGLPQWWVLRRHVNAAGWWIPANALAWAVGMPVVFAGVGLAANTASIPLAVVWGAGSLLLASAVVGAVHGLCLWWLLAAHTLDGK